MESNLLEEIEKNCLKFDSFEALRIKYSDNNEVETVLELFIKKLIDIFSNMMLGSEESTLSKEGIREKIHKNPEIFKRVCSVLRNVNILKGKIKNTTISPTKEYLKRHRSNYKSKKKNSKIKSIIRLIPKTSQTHQLMMKLSNFPRLEIKISSNRHLKSIIDYLKKKWLRLNPSDFTLELFPDTKTWLSNISLTNSSTTTNLMDSLMIEDLLSGYNYPENNIIYLFYEIKENKTFNIAKNFVEIPKNNEKIKIINDENSIFDPIEYFESKRKTFSNNNCENTEKSQSVFSFSQRMPIKNETNTNNISNFSNFKLINFKENSDVSQFIKKNEFLASNGINFGNSMNFYENSFLKFKDNNSKGSESEFMRKDQEHLKKISDLIDLVGKKR